MEYKYFEYSRDLNTDYEWKIKPTKLSAGFSKVIQKLNILRDEMRNYADIMWEKVVFFFNYEDVNIACQSIMNGTDYVGRPIYCTRGVISDSNIRSVLGMPDLILDLYQNDFQEYVEDQINPLLPFDKSDNTNEYMPNAFVKMVSDIRAGKCTYSCVVGPSASVVFDRAKNILNNGIKLFTNCYDFSLSYDVATDLEETLVVIPSMKGKYNYPLDNRVELYIRFYNVGKNRCAYEWIVRKVSDEKSIKSSKLYFDDYLSVSELYLQERKIKTHYSRLGYVFE